MDEAGVWGYVHCSYPQMKGIVANDEKLQGKPLIAPLWNFFLYGYGHNASGATLFRMTSDDALIWGKYMLRSIIE